MIKRIKETAYDWYVLNVREFYKKWIENIGVRIREVKDMPFWVYKEHGSKEVFLECWQLPYTEADEKYMNSLRRCCDKGVERLRLESKLGLS